MLHVLLAMQAVRPTNMARQTRQVVASLLVVLALGALQAQAVPVAATVEAIQAAINDAADNSGTVIEIAGGIVTAGNGADMGTTFILLNKHGVSLHGSSDANNPTIFQTSQTTAVPGALGVPSCQAASEGLALLQVCRQASGVTPTQPIVIENIIFKSSYTDSSLPTAPYGGAEKGIYIEANGPSAATPNTIKNCAFLNMWKSGNTGFGVEFSTKSKGDKLYLIKDNRFEGTRQCIFLNPNSYITVTGNAMTK